MASNLTLNLKENFKERYIAFIDVMGFSNLVNKSRIDNLESYFSKITEVLEDLKNDKKEIDSFLISDSIILLSDDSLEGLKQLLVAVKRIQYGLLWRKILMRGAISFGQVYYNREKNIIVDKGFIRAYLLEQEAIYPRVIIDPLIVRKVGRDRTNFLYKVNNTKKYSFENRLVYKKTQFCQINDDGVFVDYANWAVKQDKIEGLNFVHETIVENLYAEQKLYSKYVWLRDYFIECLEITKSLIEDTATKEYKTQLKKWLSKFKRL